MKKVIIIQIVLSLIFTAVFVAGNKYGYIDSFTSAIQRDYSITEISKGAVETLRNMNVK